PVLNDSIEQLSTYCSGVETEAGYMLESLTEEETGHYLASRLKAAGRTVKGEISGNESVFSAGAIRKIFNATDGTPALINILAESSLQAASADNASVVQPAHVIEQNNLAAGGGTEGRANGKPRNRLRTLILTAVLAGLLLFCMQNGLLSNLQEIVERPVAGEPDDAVVFLPIPETADSSRQDIEPVSTGTDPALLKQESPEVTMQGQDELGGQSLPENSLEPSVNSVLFLPIPQHPDFDIKNKNVPSGDSEKTVRVETVRIETEEDIPENFIGNEQISSLSDVIEIPGIAVPPESTKQEAENKEDEISPEQTPEQTPEQMQEAVSEVPAVEGAVGNEHTIASTEPGAETLAMAKKLPVIKPYWIVELKPGMKKSKVKPEGNPLRLSRSQQVNREYFHPVEVARRGLRIVTEAEQRRSAVADYENSKEKEPKIKLLPVPFPAAPSNANQVFQDLLMAGTRWTNKYFTDKYTIQMLVLSSQDAADNIKKMIIRDEYLEHKEQLYLLRRKTVPPTLFICYGVYNTLNAAEKARNALPLFLRKHHPYALSIPHVLAKTNN
ncbi:MAG: hypothetical protein D3924_12730, partial [Candidatus Electrothrix sp. AR4]|nr:hypothetical protein [Candidatus Electrothrix sp. AR4]